MFLMNFRSTSWKRIAVAVQQQQLVVAEHVVLYRCCVASKLVVRVEQQIADGFKQ